MTHLNESLKILVRYYIGYISFKNLLFSVEDSFINCGTIGNNLHCFEFYKQYF